MALPIVWSPVVDQHKKMECTCAPCKAFWKGAFQDGADRIARGSNERAECTGALGNQGGLLRKGDRVLVQGKLPGVVQYVGYADDHLVAPDMHVGVCLYDNAYTTHNGVYRGKRFFTTPRGHGAMVKYSEISPLNAIPRTRNVNGNSMFPSFELVKKKRREREDKIKKEEEQLKQEYETRRRAQMERYSRSAPPPTFSPRPTRASKMRTEGMEPKPRQPLQDEYDIAYRRQATCTCSPCKKFWRRAFQEVSERPEENNPKASVHKGDRVLVHGDQLGVVRYVGYADDHLVAPELHVGVCLFKNAESNDSGIYHGKRYFHTDEGHAAMVKLSEVKQLEPAPRTRPVNGNPMFPSYGEVQKKRKEMKKKEAKERKNNETEKRNGKPNCSKSLHHQETRDSSNDTKPYHGEHAITERDHQQEERHFQQMKKAFGGNEKGERMAMTYTKLEKAFEKGKIWACIEKH